MLITALTLDKLDEFTASQINPIILAYIGDSVQSIYIRTKLILHSSKKAKILHDLSSSVVNASSQAKAYENLAKELTQSEDAIFKRARNCKNRQGSKSSSVNEYRKATGFEAVLGYLYLTGQTERLNYILDKSSVKLDDIT